MWFIVGPPIIRQFKHGQSNPTYYVEYGGQKLVIRKKPVSDDLWSSLECSEIITSARPK